MKPRLILFTRIVAVLAVFIAGCGKKGSKPANTVEVITPAIDLATAGTLRGEVLFQGEPPKARKLKISGNPECASLAHGDLYSEEVVVTDGKLVNAVVYIKEGLENYQFPIPKEPVLLDQKNCAFVPHVIAVQQHQLIELLNSDSTLHNVNAKPKNSRGFNIGFPTKGMKRAVAITQPEVSIPVRCDLHPWMKNYMAVFNHPYFKVINTDGAFSFSPLSPGKYVVEVWHETLGIQTREVEIKANQTEEVTFSF